MLLFFLIYLPLTQHSSLTLAGKVDFKGLMIIIKMSSGARLGVLRGGGTIYNTN